MATGEFQLVFGLGHSDVSRQLHQGRHSHRLPDDARLPDETKLEQLGGELIKQLNNTTEERVILDFRNVKFMSSSMLGKLVQLQKKCKEFKVHLKLSAISPDIRQVFKITKLDKLFEIEDDEAAARKAFMRRGWFG